MIDPRTTQADGHGEAAAYLLGAMDPAARARFEVHATTCAECFTELSELQPVADTLALSVPQLAPPHSIRQRLLTRAHLSAPEPARSGSNGQVPLRPLPAPPPVPAVQPWWQQAQRYSSGLAAASLVVAMASGAYAVSAQRQMTDVAQRAEYATAQLSETLQIIYQPNMVARTLNGMDGAPQATGKVVLAPDRNKAVVIAYSLPKLEKDESYQCWLTHQDDKRIDGGVFKPDANGKAYWVMNVPETMARYRWINVTKEKGKGAAAPTGPRVLGGQL